MHGALQYEVRLCTARIFKEVTTFYAIIVDAWNYSPTKKPGHIQLLIYDKIAANSLQQKTSKYYKQLK